MKSLPCSRLSNRHTISPEQRQFWLRLLCSRLSRTRPREFASGRRDEWLFRRHSIRAEPFHRRRGGVGGFLSSMHLLLQDAPLHENRSSPFLVAGYARGPGRGQLTSAQLRLSPCTPSASQREKKRLSCRLGLPGESMVHHRFGEALQ